MLERLKAQSFNGNNYKLDGTPSKYLSNNHLISEMSAVSYRDYPQTPKSSSKALRNQLPDPLVLDALPPNTGPAGTVETTGTGNLSTANKNLSHVPCKFFKQGICQAGKSCPFSHDLDGSTGADKLPCKYFQKGNCKFGLKCALAHFLPDGTRVNNKSLQSYRRGSDRQERSRSYGGQTTPNISNSVLPGTNSAYYYKTSLSSYNSTGLADPIDIGRNSSYTSNGQRLGEKNLSPTSMSLAPLESSRTNLFLSSNTTSQLQDAFGRGEWLTQQPFNFSANLFSQSSTGLTLNGFGLSGANQSPSEYTVASFNWGSRDIGETEKPTSSTSLPSFNAAFHGKNSSSSSPVLLYGQIIPDEAIIDDYDNRDDDEPFYEDFVPASIGNLILTPQEKKRRDSRSQSGTLLVRPTIAKSPGQQLVLEKSWAQLIAPKDTESLFLMD